MLEIRAVGWILEMVWGCLEEKVFGSYCLVF